jgi:hypothetical protein
MVALQGSLCLLWLLMLSAQASTPPHLYCRDPDVGGTTQNRDRKFAVSADLNITR